MNSTTTAPAAALAVGCILPTAQLAWDREDWVESYEDCTYERSVMWATDARGWLCVEDLVRLLEDHGRTLADLADDLDACAEAGHEVADFRHAGQALTWLGY